MRIVSPLLAVAALLAACGSTDPASPVPPVVDNLPPDHFESTPDILLDRAGPDPAAEAREEYYRDNLDSDIRDLEQDSLRGRLDPMERRELLDLRNERAEDRLLNR